MPLAVSLKSFPEDQTTRVYRVVDSETSFYFDVYFIQAPFGESHYLTAFVDPVGYVELNPSGTRKNLPPVHFQAVPESTDSEWANLAINLVTAYLGYRRTGTHRWMIRPQDPVFTTKEPDPEPPCERVSRFKREPVI
jgi:hypothetical protein